MSMSPVRVSYVIDNLGRAGTESQLLALIRALDRSRIEPSLVLLDGENETSRALEPADCLILRLGVNKLLGRTAWRASGKLCRFWNTQRPDIAQLYFLDSAYFALPIAKVCGIPKIIRVRNNLGHWLTRKHRIINRLIRPFVHSTLTNSEAGRDALIIQDGLKPAQIEVIENGVDLDRFPIGRRPFSDATIRIGCVANLRPVKNIDGLMRAAVELPDAIFEVAGDGESRAELEDLKVELGLGDRFRLLGSVTDIPAFLATLDVAVLPSHSEGMSNALLEFMAAGRPIAATATGATPRLLDGGIYGELAADSSPEEIARAIRVVIDHPNRAQRMGESARDRVQLHYSRDAMRLRFEEFYHRLAGRTVA